MYILREIFIMLIVLDGLDGLVQQTIFASPSFLGMLGSKNIVLHDHGGFYSVKVV